MTDSRRNFLRKAAIGGGLTAFAAGFATTGARMVEHALGHDVPKDRLHGNSLKPEFRLDPATGKLELDPNQQVSYTGCLGCTTQCGVRVRIDKQSGKVLRVAGNPYSPLSTDPHLPMKASIRDSFVALSRLDEKGLAGRSTACGRGNAVLSQMDSPFRVLTPLKRVGPRNGGQWQPIPFEQLVKELTEGGDLFGEGHVDGLKALRNFDPIDPAAPQLGPRVNQVAVWSSVNDGREPFARRFWQQAYGTLNFVGHGSYCGGAYRSGSGAMFGDLKKMPHAKPDFAQAEFVIFVGTAPGNAGNPFKRQGTLLAKARTGGKLNYVVVDPVLSNADNLATRERGNWIPIKPGTDGALGMAMIRWILDEKRHDAAYLSNPNAAVALANGEPSWSNASHLIVRQPDHPRFGRFLRASDMGWISFDKEEDRYGDGDAFVVIPAGGGALLAHDAATTPAELEYTGSVDVAGSPMQVQTSFTLLAASARQESLAAYSAACGIPEATIVGLAREFTSHGKRAAINAHGGMMSGSGFYNTFSLMMLNTLIGNLNWKGGTLRNGGGFKEDGEGPRYNLAAFPGQIKPSGTPLGRNVPYEKSAEFARKKAAGEKPYPAAAPWFPNAPGLTTHWLPAALGGNPYPLKALILWSCNPIYGVTGLRAQVEKELADPKKLPLIVSVDPLINESNAFADYIVPDSLMYESWGWASAWGAVPTKASTARWPVVEPKADKLADGQAIGMETFFIALAKSMVLPGFGRDAISDADGKLFPLERPEDWYLRAGANVAWLGKEPVADASDDDLAMSGLARLQPALEHTLKPEEWRKVAFVLARGGRYQPYKDTYDEEHPEWATNRWDKPMQVYNEMVGASKDSQTGKRFSGVPMWLPPRFADGTPVRSHYTEQDWPLQLISFKSALMNSYAIASPRLRGLHPSNPVSIHADDAKRLGLSHGDEVMIETPGGKRAATVLIRHGIMRGVVAVEHGYGHKELGARAHKIGGERQPELKGLDAGVNLNDLGLADPTVKGKSVWVDPVSGTSVRQGIPARLVKA